jgi:hypothetical protein
MYDAVPRQVQPKNSKCGRTQRESPQADSKSVLATVSFEKIACACEINLPQASIADSKFHERGRGVVQSRSR